MFIYENVCCSCLYILGILQKGLIILYVAVRGIQKYWKHLRCIHISYLLISHLPLSVLSLFPMPGFYGNTTYGSNSCFPIFPWQVEYRPLLRPTSRHRKCGRLSATQRKTHISLIRRVPTEHVPTNRSVQIFRSLHRGPDFIPGWLMWILHHLCLVLQTFRYDKLVITVHLTQMWQNWLQKY